MECRRLKYARFEERNNALTTNYIIHHFAPKVKLNHAFLSMNWPPKTAPYTCMRYAARCPFLLRQTHMQDDRSLCTNTGSKQQS